MKLTKAEKETILLTSEADDTWEVYTFNPGLMKKLAAFSERYPDLCRLKEKYQETGSVIYIVEKSRLSIHLNAPYSEERRRAASEKAKAHRLNKKTEAETNG